VRINNIETILRIRNQR